MIMHNCCDYTKVTQKRAFTIINKCILMLLFFQYGHRKNYKKNIILYSIAPSVAIYMSVAINNGVNNKYTLFCLHLVFKPCYWLGSNSSKIHILYLRNCFKNVILWVKAVALKDRTLSRETKLPE